MDVWPEDALGHTAAASQERNKSWPLRCVPCGSWGAGPLVVGACLTHNAATGLGLRDHRISPVGAGPRHLGHFLQLSQARGGSGAAALDGGAATLDGGTAGGSFPTARSQWHPECDTLYFTPTLLTSPAEPAYCPEGHPNRHIHTDDRSSTLRGSCSRNWLRFNPPLILSRSSTTHTRLKAPRQSYSHPKRQITLAHCFQ